MFSKKPQFSDPNKERISKHLRAADDLVRRKRYEDALLEIERAYKLDPKSMYIRSFLERTRFMIQKADEEKAKIFGESNMLMERRMETISQLLASAEEFVKAKKYPRALAVIAKVYQIDPKNYYAQAFSERIETLMQAESANKGTTTAPPDKTESFTGTSMPPTSNITPLEIQRQDKKPPAPSSFDSSQYDVYSEGPVLPQYKSPEETGSSAMYRELLKECWADGIITAEESDMLHNVRSKYGISFDEHCRLETAIKIDAYVDALRIVWRDGVITDNEQEVLEIMRKKYGLTREDREEAERKFSTLQNAETGKALVLVVDPDQEELISSARALISQGYDVKISQRAESALQFLSTSIPDLILSEVTFAENEMDGFEFYQKVRADKRLTPVPFIIMAYPGDAQVVRAGLRLGVDYFIPKPLHIDFMVAVVEGKIKSGR